MSLIDFIIGLTLMNAMPHWVLGVWQGRILGGLGFGNKQNMAYGLINFAISMGLYSWKYGFSDIMDNGILLGALFVLIIYFVSGHFLYNLFVVKQKAKQG